MGKPTHIQPATIAAKEDVLEEIKIAEAIMDSVQVHQNHIREIAAPPGELQSLQNQVAQLTRDVQRVLLNNHNKFGANATRYRQPCSFIQCSTTAIRQCKKGTITQISYHPKNMQSYRLRIYDTSAKINFLIDTGVDVSVIPNCSQPA